MGMTSHHIFIESSPQFAFFFQSKVELILNDASSFFLVMVQVFLIRNSRTATLGFAHDARMESVHRTVVLESEHIIQSVEWTFHPKSHMPKY